MWKSPFWIDTSFNNFCAKQPKAPIIVKIIIITLKSSINDLSWTKSRTLLRWKATSYNAHTIQSLMAYFTSFFEKRKLLPIQAFECGSDGRMLESLLKFEKPNVSSAVSSHILSMLKSHIVFSDILISIRKCENLLPIIWNSHLQSQFLY